jgi:hypothetical protein
MDWQALGLSEDDFWRRTPRQIMRTFEAYVRKQQREHNERMSLAWHIAALPRMKTFPSSPQKLFVKIKDPRRRPRQTPEQMLAIAKQWAVFLGGKVVKRRKKEG